MGEDTTHEGIDECSVFFFRLFLHTSKVDKQKGEKVKKMFGPFPSTTVSQIGQLVQSVLIAIPVLKEMLSLPEETPSPDTAQQGTQEQTESFLNSRPFGTEIRFNPVYNDVTELPADYSDEFTHSLSMGNGDTMDNEERSGDEFSIAPQDLSSRFPPFWLLDQLKLLFVNEDAREKCGAVINLLSGPECSEVIAEALFECLGDLGIELVHTLLENRLV